MTIRQISGLALESDRGGSPEFIMVDGLKLQCFSFAHLWRKWWEFYSFVIMLL